MVSVALHSSVLGLAFWFRRLPESLPTTFSFCWVAFSGICLVSSLAAGGPHTSVARFRFCQVVRPARLCGYRLFWGGVWVGVGLLLRLGVCAFVPAASACELGLAISFSVGSGFSVCFVARVARQASGLFQVALQVLWPRLLARCPRLFQVAQF